MLAFYRRKLLVRGWAGATDDVEKAYMASHAEWYQKMQERGRELAATQGFGKAPEIGQDRPKPVGEPVQKPSTEELGLVAQQGVLIP